MSHSYNSRKKAIKRGQAAKGKKWDRYRALLSNLKAR